MSDTRANLDVSSCPTKETLEKFMEGRLSPLEVERIALHLNISQCCECHRFCDNFVGPDDELIKGIQSSHFEPPCRLDAYYRELLDAHESNRVARTGADQIQPGYRPNKGTRIFREGSFSSLAIGPFQLLEPIGRGGMGDVFRAVDSRTHRQVAMKLIRTDRFSDPEFTRRFRDEAETAAHLDHPNIVPVYEVNFGRIPYFIVMKFIDGKPLSDLAADYLPDVNRSAKLMISVAEAIHYAHQRRVIHRDLKPANVVVDRAGVPYITDFGLSKRIGAESTKTHGSGILGTPGYMAPEQVVGEPQGLTTAIDVYGLGGVLYFLLTGQPPFSGNREMDILRNVVDREPKPPRQICSGVPRDLETICMKCLSKDPHKRYGSAEAVAKDLDRWFQGEPVLARRARWSYRMQRWCQRRPLVATLTAIALLLTLTVSVGGPLSAILIQRQSVATRRNLFDLQIALARAERYSEIPNHRQTAFNAVEGALQAARGFTMTPQQKLNLRNEAIAAMAYPEVKLENSWSIPSAYPAVDASLEHFAYVTSQGDLVVRDLEDGHERARFPGPAPTLDAIQISPAARYLAVPYMTKPKFTSLIDLMGFATKVVHNSLEQLGKPTLLDFELPNRHGLALYSIDEAQLLWITEFGLVPDQLAFSEDGNLIAAATDDGRIHVWETKSGNLVNRLSEPDFNRFAWRPHSPQLTIANQTHVVRSINVFTNRVEATYHLPDVIEDVVWQKTGHSFAAISQMTIYLWDAEANRLIRIFREHESAPIVKLSFGSHDTLCASVGHGDHTLVWAPHSGCLLTRIKGHYPYIAESSSKLAITRAAQGNLEINVWNVSEPAELSSFQIGAESSEYLQSVAFSQDGKTVAACGVDGLYVWEPVHLSDGRFVPLLGAFGVAAGPAPGQWLVNTEHGLLSVRLARSSDLPAEINDVAPIRPSRFYQLASCAGGHRIAASCGFGRALLLDLQTGIKRHIDIGNDETPIAVSPDGRWFVSLAGAGADAEILAWDFLSGERAARIGSSERGYNKIAISNDGRRIAVGSSIAYRCFEQEAGGSWRHIYTVPRPERGIWGSAAFSHDGRNLAIVDTKEMVKIVEASTGNELCRLNAPAPRFTITDLCFSPDDAILTLVGEGRHIHCWNIQLIRKELAEKKLDW